MRLLLAALVVASTSPAYAYEDRHVFVTNRGGNDIVELDESLARVRTWFAGEGLSVPNGMAFTPSGAIWVADTGNDRIVAFDLAGSRVLTIAAAARVGDSIESIYFAGDGTLFGTANPGIGTVARWSIEGAEQADLVAGDPAFEGLGNVNITLDGRVIVSDFSGTLRGLRELDPVTGAILRTFGRDLGRQEDVMIDGADRVFVSHIESDEIVVFDAERTELFRFTTPASEPSPLQSPTGIALTHDCRILVAGFMSHRIYEWRHVGASPPTYVGSVAIEGLSSPESIAIAGLALPGGFEEFADRVPRCDELRSDAGVPVDAGGATDAGRAIDAGDRDAAQHADGGRAPRHSPSGCACRLAGRSGHASLAAGIAALVALAYGARAKARRRKRTIASGARSPRA
jgi:hypothetical protein